MNLSGAFKSPTSCVLSLGGFDALHKGHQSLIKALVKKARSENKPSLLLIFDPLPFQVLKGEKNFTRIFLIEEAREFLKNLDLDFLSVVSFDTKLSKISARDFVSKVFYSQFQASHILSGYNLGFGRGREGNLDLLKSLSKEFSFSVSKEPAFLFNNTPISSSLVRKHLEKGEMEEVSSLLGRHYFVSSKVLRGEKKGKDLGFPTANLSLKGKKVPRRGVYQGLAFVDGKRHKAACNLGKRPTFLKDGEMLLEAHLLDFEGDLYDKKIKVELVSFLREERKFEGEEDLKKTILEDIKKVQSS